MNDFERRGEGAASPGGTSRPSTPSRIRSDRRHRGRDHRTAARQSVEQRQRHRPVERREDREVGRGQQRTLRLDRLEKTNVGAEAHGLGALLERHALGPRTRECRNEQDAAFAQIGECTEQDLDAAARLEPQRTHPQRTHRPSAHTRTPGQRLGPLEIVVGQVGAIGNRANPGAIDAPAMNQLLGVALGRGGDQVGTLVDPLGARVGDQGWNVGVAADHHRNAVGRRQPRDSQRAGAGRVMHVDQSGALAAELKPLAERGAPIPAAGIGLEALDRDVLVAQRPGQVVEVGRSGKPGADFIAPAAQPGRQLPQRALGQTDAAREIHKGETDGLIVHVLNPARRGGGEGPDGPLPADRCRKLAQECGEFAGLLVKDPSLPVPLHGS